MRPAREGRENDAVRPPRADLAWASMRPAREGRENSVIFAPPVGKEELQ